MKRKLIWKEPCVHGDPNCTTRYYDNGDVECVMYIPSEDNDGIQTPQQTIRS